MPFLRRRRPSSPHVAELERRAGITLRPSNNLSRMNSTSAMTNSQKRSDSFDKAGGAVGHFPSEITSEEQLNTSRAKETSDLPKAELMELTHLKTRSLPAPRNLARPRRRRRSPRPLMRLPKAISQWLQGPCSGHCGPGRSAQGPL